MENTKLVRDRLEPGGPGIRLGKVRDLAHHSRMLVSKLHEEVDEVAASNFEDVIEYADVLQALMDLAHISGIPWKEVEIEQIRKEVDCGGFRIGRLMIK